MLRARHVCQTPAEAGADRKESDLAGGPAERDGPESGMPTRGDRRCDRMTRRMEPGVSRTGAMWSTGRRPRSEPGKGWRGPERI